MSKKGNFNVFVLVFIALIIFAFVTYHNSKRELNLDKTVVEQTNLPVNKEDSVVVIDNNSSQDTNCNPSSAPSIVVTNPMSGAIYSVGEKVEIKWTSCNITSVGLGLVSGGKDFGELTQTPIPATQESFEFTVSDPMQGFTGTSGNSYQIGIYSTSPDVMVKSNEFKVQ